MADDSVHVYAQEMSNAIAALRLDLTGVDATAYFDVPDLRHDGATSIVVAASGLVAALAETLATQFEVIARTALTATVNAVDADAIRSEEETRSEVWYGACEAE